MSNDRIVRLEDVLAALGEEPELVSRFDDESIGWQAQWRKDVNAIGAVPSLPFGIHELTELEICTLHGDMVIVSAPTMPELNKRGVPCLGSHKDLDGQKYIVLDGEEYSQSLFNDGTIHLYQIV